MHVRTCTVPARRLVGFDRLRSGGVKTTRNDRRISGNTDFVIDERLCTLHYHRFYVLLNNHECMAKYAQPNIRYIIICIFFFCNSSPKASSRRGEYRVFIDSAKTKSFEKRYTSTQSTIVCKTIHRLSGPLFVKTTYRLRRLSVSREKHGRMGNGR